MADPNPPSDFSGDPLSEALHAMRMQGILYCRATLRGDWGIEVPHLDGMTGFVALTAGRAWFEMEGTAPRWLERGSLTLVPHGSAHRLLAAPGARAVPLGDLPIRQITERYETVSVGDGGDVTQATYGVVRFDSQLAQRLIGQLPEVIFNDHRNLDTDQWMESTLRFISREAADLKPGGETVLTRLADVLIIQAIRGWLDHAPRARLGWLGAMRDVNISRAMSAMHQRPGRAWTVALLAGEAALSRSVFSARFTDLMGQGALSYLTEWRVGLAASLLQETDLSQAQIAARVGYGSEPAFGRAFKRVTGHSPGQLRRGRDRERAGGG